MEKSYSCASDPVPPDRMEKAQRNLHKLAVVNSSLRDLITQISNRRSCLSKEREIMELMRDIANIVVHIGTVQTENREEQDISPSLSKEAIEVRQLTDILTVLVDGVLAPPSGFYRANKRFAFAKS